MIKRSKKYSRRFNHRLVKCHANYSTQDIAELFRVHINTVNGWYEKGLRVIDQQKQYLVFGQDLIDFLIERNKQMKKKSGPDEFFCCKCKAPRKTRVDAVGLVAINSKKVMIEGVCVICGTKMNKLGAAVKINALKELFNVQVVQQGHLLGCDTTSVTTGEMGAENEAI
jgi:hypothetical protein